MKRRFAVLVTGLAVAGVLGSAPAAARPIEKGHFHDVFTSDVYDCDGISAQGPMGPLLLDGTLVQSGLKRNLPSR